MQDPERFSQLPAYAFPRLRSLLDAHAPGGEVLHMSIGEPKHPMPSFVAEVIAAHAGEFAQYPPNDGSPELLAAIVGWLNLRYGVDTTPDRIMALNGTREGLFNAAIALCPEEKNGRQPVVLVPNPFYQVYAVAAAAVGAEPVFVPAVAETGHLPDYAALPAEVLDRTAIAYICSPANPQGAVASRDYWRGLIGLAEKHDFRIFADECYSEIWRKAPPPGALEVAAEMGADPERIVVLSFPVEAVRTCPGLRSGFRCRGRAQHGACAPIAGLCRGALALALAAGGGTGLVGRGACGGEPGALPGKIRDRRQAVRRPAGLSATAGGGSFCGCRSRMARRRR